MAEPELIPTAIEEFLRVYAPVTMAREVVRGHDARRPDRCTPASGCCCPSRPATATRRCSRTPSEVHIDRQHNRHCRLRLGIHRCLGSNLARMELRVASRSGWRAFPDFSWSRALTVEWNGGQVRGPRSLPLELGPRP